MSRTLRRQRALTERPLALLGSRAGLDQLDRRLAPGTIAVRLVPGDDVAARLREAGRPTVDSVIVLHAADAFDSVTRMVATLKQLADLGVGFVSLDEPWLNQPATVWAPAPAGVLPPGLADRAARFFELNIEEIEARRAAVEEERRGAAMQAELGRLLGQLLVLVPFAVVVGVVSQAVLNASLLDPALLSSRLRELVTGSTAVTGAVSGAIPDALRGIVFSAVSSLLLLLFRGTSVGLRAELGGVLFTGVVAACVYALSAGIATGLVGALTSIPGLVLAAVLFHQFAQLVSRITSPDAAGSPRRPAARPLGRIRHLLAALEGRLQPRRRQALAGFIGIPILVLVVSIAAAVTNGGWLFWPARLGLGAFVVWTLWAVVVTPAALRLPVWSMLPWAAALLLLSAATIATAVFAGVVVLLLLSIVFDLVLHPAIPARQ